MSSHGLFNSMTVVYRSYYMHCSEPHGQLK